MRVCDIDYKDVHIGMRVKGLATGRPGTIVKIDLDRDYYAWIQWDGETQAYSGFWWNAWEGEIILEGDEFLLSKYGGGIK